MKKRSCCSPKVMNRRRLMMAIASDGRSDGIESAIDCRRLVCGDCGTGGESCLEDQDCQTSACVGGVCTPATCQNGKQGAGETGVDCGGNCPLCPGDACAESNECAQGNCFDGACEAPLSCFNNEQDDGEEDIDCGGDCNPCSQGQVGQCDNGVLDDGEDDVDCGGACPACDIGSSGGGGAGGQSGSGSGGGGGVGGSGGTDPGGCDTGDCNTCLDCADATTCSLEYDDCVIAQSVSCLYNCAGDFACADQQCGGDTSAGDSIFAAIWGCENCE